MTTLRRLFVGLALLLTAACSSGGERATAPSRHPRELPGPPPTPHACVLPSHPFLLGSRTPETA